MSRVEELAVLKKHRDNLSKSQSFEEYRNAHVVFVDYLIEKMELDIEQRTVVDRYLEWQYIATETIIRTEQTKDEDSRAT